MSPLVPSGEKPLEPMVIQFDPGRISEAWELIGQKEQYVTQLQKEMMRRASVANDLDDDNKRMRELLPKYETELAELREKAATLELELRLVTGEAGSRRRKKKA